VAVQFFLLAPYVGVESVRGLIGGDHPDVSWVGIGLAIGSVILMPMLGIAKQRLADQLGSAATAGEGRQNMLCAYLAGALLVGLLGNLLVGAWWLDPAVGLLIAGVAVKEGVEAWRGEGCCVSSPLDGVGFAHDDCDDDCCQVVAACREASGGARPYAEPRARRNALAEEVAELTWDLGGLTYEMAIRDHFRLDVLVRRAAALQERDAELGEVERLLAAADQGVGGDCRSCRGPHSRGAGYCWKCGQPLMPQATSAALIEPLGETGG
jgi:Cation efflux family